MSQVTEKAVLDALRMVEDPDLRKDIVSLGFVKDLAIKGGDVRFTIELTTPACPVKDMMKNAAINAVSEIPGVTSVDVNMTAQVRGPQSGGAPAGPGHLPGIAHIVPVASGKGGVGKSTVSANLAVALAAQGARVGLMDADIYGPSIPAIMGITTAPQVSGGRILPVEQYGVKVISMGFFIEEKQAVVWRGPMLAKALDEFLGNVEWGELDYLIIDLPPGTGDVQLSLCQKLALTGAVVVSTPQDVALKVAQKAITLFEMLKTPVLGLVENMSYYVCKHCGERDDIFGNGGTRRAAEELGLAFLGDLPLATAIREHCDAGRPSAVDADSPAGQAFRTVAEQLAAQISIRTLSGELGGKIELSF
ncbi:MAG: Mrp/NBP35 family ATP-binding protein [Candidatus Krumholzibacteriia bacterium]|nr:Mrp/NBP35 family ATP-binding protein [bacterium]MCB9513075.1 Mrp/NBP35 family ATP-binding protein [Candidatus Latescibacterota bacterium]MCB9516266.1 Mrp/NBP35 family ATP-binding protein [Candidatus Latescibacterota bacterium]